MILSVRPMGEANTFVIEDENKHWRLSILANGEMPDPTQMELLERMALSFNILEAWALSELKLLQNHLNGSRIIRVCITPDSEMNVTSIIP